MSAISEKKAPYFYQKGKGKLKKGLHYTKISKKVPNYLRGHLIVIDI